ncbi:MAG: large ribosomal subunit protein uL3 [Candidatus Hodgkinia cicadicola]
MLDFSWFEVVKNVDVSTRTKGKGFAGVMKRYGFRGLCSSHGVSLAHRSCGSIGARQDPGRVWKGKKMAGRLGFNIVTVRNVKVAQFSPFTQCLLLYGSIPGTSLTGVHIAASA